MASRLRELFKTAIPPLIPLVEPRVPAPITPAGRAAKRSERVETR